MTTVLTYSDVLDDGKGGGAVACIKTLSKIPESRVSGDVRTSVRIIGENFTAEVSAPIPVRLKTAHKPPGMDDFMRVASQRPVISCHRKGGGRVRAIHLDFQATLDAFSQMGDSRLQSWIERAINWYVPRNLGWIIHDSSDEGHGALLECVQRILGAQGYPKNLRLCDVRDGFDRIWGDVGVLVLSPVTATGRLFSRVNRELRLGEHRGNRIFLSPFVMAPSTHAFTSLRNSLCYAPEGFKYQFLNFMSLRVGHSAIDDSWSQEAALPLRHR